ncbi:hypothetical protein KY285_009461 [Solanum tuberosum]|nr:hypothetical protein KY285_009461 [Solanum tuberosum]
MTPASFFFFSANPDENQQHQGFQQPKSRPETSQQLRKRTAGSRHASGSLSPSGMSQNLKEKVFSRKGHYSSSSRPSIAAQEKWDGDISIICVFSADCTVQF